MCVNFSKSLKGNKFVIAVTLAVLLSELRTVLSTNAVATDWWLDPCSTGNQQIQRRHARSAGTRQLNISINYMKRLKETLNAIYPNFKDKNSHKYGNCLKLKRLIDPIRQEKNKLKAMTSSYESLSVLAMFLDKLMNIPVRHESMIFSETKRTKYYNKMKSIIKLYLCEASYDIFEMDPTMKTTLFESVSQKKKLREKNLKCLPKQLDHTSAQMNDFSFYNKLFRFLKQVKNRLRKLGKKGKLGSKNSQRKLRRTT